MENILQSLANEKGLLPLVLITIVSVMICLWKYGGDIMNLFKSNKKSQIEDVKEIFNIARIENKEIYERFLAESKYREEESKSRELATQKVLQDATATNKELSETNAKLADMINIRIDNIEEDVKDVKEDMRDIKESITIIRTRTEK